NSSGTAIVCASHGRWFANSSAFQKRQASGPTVTFVDKPEDPSTGLADGIPASFEWAVDDSTASQACTLDGGAPLPCDGSRDLTVPLGPQVWGVRATTGSGSGSASYVGTAYGQLPTIDLTPTPPNSVVPLGGGQTAPASFTWNAPGVTGATRCVLDGG